MTKKLDQTVQDGWPGSTAELGETNRPSHEAGWPWPANTNQKHTFALISNRGRHPASQNRQQAAAAEFQPTGQAAGAESCESGYPAGPAKLPGQATKQCYSKSTKRMGPAIVAEPQEGKTRSVLKHVLKQRNSHLEFQKYYFFQLTR